MNKKVFLSIKKGGLYSIWIILLLVAFFPIYYLITGAFKPEKLLFGYPPTFFRFYPTIANISTAFETSPLLKHFMNSLMISILSVGLVIFLSVLTAYALSRFRFRGANAITLLVIGIRWVPSMSLVIPLYMLFRRIGLLDTRISIILAHTLFNLPLAVLLLRSYFAGISVALEEAALMDGCSGIGAFFRISLPLVRPGIVATAVLCFIFSWNELLYALVLSNVKSVTLPVTLSSFITMEGILWGQLFGVASVMVFPVVIFAPIIWKSFISGLSLGGLKG